MCFVLTQQHWLLPNVWLDPPNMKTTKIMCSDESKSLPPNTIPDYYALLHLTVPFIPPNPIYTYNTGKKNNFQNVCILHYICHLSFNPDCCAKLLKRCILNTEKYRNTDAFVLLEWMGEGETPISRMCVQPNICHSILIFVPNIWGP